MVLTEKGVLVWGQSGLLFIDSRDVVELEVFEGSPLRLTAGAPRVSVVYRGEDDLPHSCTITQFATAYRSLPFDAKRIAEALGGVRR